MDEATRDDIQVLLVSVDPRRDDAETLRTYTAAFGPQFIGLTGDKEAIDELTHRYRVTYGYGEKDNNGNYDVSHSSDSACWVNRPALHAGWRGSGPSCDRADGAAGRRHRT
jgi:cytochrome oxidase Cu insertion factor (SCO1/SenC/PrrC family)